MHAPNMFPGLIIVLAVFCFYQRVIHAFSFVCRPDMTFAVDWALKNPLSIYSFVCDSGDLQDRNAKGKLTRTHER